MVKVAVVLSGCGHLDGAEIRESVLTLLALDQADADVTIFAPNIPQTHVVNHITGDVTKEQRNVLEESARIARGDIYPLEEAVSEEFDALILPGGYGAAKNLSTLAFKGKDAVVYPPFKRFVQGFLKQGKPIGAICISPAVLVAALKHEIHPTVTIGDDQDGLIESLGGTHEFCETADSVADEANRIYSCSAYMRGDARISDVAAGIDEVVLKTLKAASKKSAQKQPAKKKKRAA